MDVIGNNIANVNTVGFKSSRVTFRDVLYQTYSNPTTPSDEDPVRGGTNPSQIGLGVYVSSVDVLNTRAGPMTTDRPFDCYIDGEGYFKVQGPPNADGSSPEYYTRVGDFTIDPLGNLVDGNGNFVMGVPADSIPFEMIEGSMEPNIPADVVPIKIEDYIKNKYAQISIGPDGIITGLDNETQTNVPLGQILMFRFPNNDGLSQVGTTYLQVTPNSGYPAVCTPGQEGTGKIAINRLEMSNVELAKEFTDMIITQRGFQANSRIITVSDEMLQELVNLKR
jgi:flagellar hook protein FlgE